MGQSSSTHRRRQDQQHQNYPPFQVIPSSSSSDPPHSPAPPPPPPQPPLSPPPPPQPPLSPPPPPPPRPPPPLSHLPPPPPPSYVFPPTTPYPAAAPYPPYPSPPQAFNSYGNGYRYAAPTTSRYGNYQYYCPGQSNGWAQFGPPPSYWPVKPQQAPPPYVEHEKATTVKNVVNVHKETIRLEVDEENPDCVLVCFTFDAVVDGSITIYYFAKEGENCNFSPLYPEIMPVNVHFHKGPSQKFCQPSGTGVDLGFFEWDQLSKPMEDDAYPLVISAQASSPHLPTEGQLGETQPNIASAQITQAILEKKNEGPFQVKVAKQILWVGGVRYELREIFGIGSSVQAEFDDSDPGKECVICMSEPKDTAVLPCRHMCMCSECAKVLRLQSNKCPICRQPVEQLIEIKVKKDDKS